MTQRAVIDRIVDGDLAVLLVGEAETERIVPVHDLPAGAKEGSWLRVIFRGADLLESALDAKATDEARQHIASKMARLRKRGRGEQ